MVVAEEGGRGRCRMWEEELGAATEEGLGVVGVCAAPPGCGGGRGV